MNLKLKESGLNLKTQTQTHIYPLCSFVVADFGEDASENEGGLTLKVFHLPQQDQLKRHIVGP